MADTKGSNSAGHLRSLIERVERLTEEKQDTAKDIREVFAEAKGAGFDPKIMRIVLRRRAMDKAERDEQDALVDTYSASLGMLPAAPDEDDEDDEIDTTSSD